jgi:ribulose-phosphate 3-epimerase
VRTSVGQLRAAGPTISAGVLAADLLHLGDQLAEVAQAGIGVVHLDVMDGRFCPQLTFGAPMVAAIPESFIADCHLMVDDPLPIAIDCIDAGAGIVTIHAEAAADPAAVLRALAGRGVIRGLALNPETSLDLLPDLLPDLELVLLLAITPGAGRQAFSADIPARVARVRDMIATCDVLVGLDGGVTADNVADVAMLGADLVVSGRAIFGGQRPADNARFMIGAVRAGLG